MLKIKILAGLLPCSMAVGSKNHLEKFLTKFVSCKYCCIVCDERSLLRSYVVVYYIMSLFTKVLKLSVPTKTFKKKNSYYTLTVLGIFSPQHFKIYHRFLKKQKIENCRLHQSMIKRTPPIITCCDKMTS